MSQKEEEIYLTDVLMKLLVQYGPSCEEDQVLDFVETELKNIDKNIEIVKDKRFGLYCLIPCIKDVEESILFDAHIDTVLHQYKKPELFTEVVKGKPRIQICATGLDNRIHCAVLLTLAKFVRFENTSYVLVFSTMEEIGKVGVFHFSRKIDLMSLYPQQMGKRIRKIVVLDVCRGKLPALSGKDLSLVGGGFVSRISTGKTNYAEYEKGFYNGIPKVLYGVINVNMHRYNSIASLSDTFELFNFLKDYENILKEEVYERVNEEMNTQEEDDEMILYHKERMKKALEKREKNKEIERENFEANKHIFQFNTQ